MRARLALLTVALAAACSEPNGSGPSDAGPPTDAGKRALCVDGRPTGPWPDGPYAIELAATLPPGLVFEDVDLKAAYEPCAAEARLLVLRSSAAWCGTCLWHAEHTKRLREVAGDLAARVQIIDLLVADEDNMPATPEAKARWLARMDAPEKLAIDPTYTFRTAQVGPVPLPTYTFVDTRTMTVLAADSDPSPELFANRVALELALLDGRERPAAIPTRHYDGLLEQHRALLAGMRVPASPPADPTNEFADSATAAALGKQLFADAALSPSGTVSCATCHLEALDYTDGVAQSTGLSKVDRNSPSVALAAHARWQFWDGRADTLWAQALGPFEDAKELGSNRLFVARRLTTTYAAQYSAAFGARYPLPDLAALPANGKPGDPAYDALSAADKTLVTRVFVNAGKAIAAFERTLRVEPNGLDRFLDGDTTALTDSEKAGMSQFFHLGCAQCHFGPRLTNDAFHVIRFGGGRQDRQQDLGRFNVLPGLATAEFNATTNWSDAPNAAKVLLLPQAESMIGAFKTPSLRGLPSSGPYGHGGTVDSLEQVANLYATRGLPHSDGSAVGTTEQWLSPFDKNAESQLPPFLRALTGKVNTP